VNWGPSRSGFDHTICVCRSIDCPVCTHWVGSCRWAARAFPDRMERFCRPCRPDLPNRARWLLGRFPRISQSSCVWYSEGAAAAVSCATCPRPSLFDSLSRRSCSSRSGRLDYSPQRLEPEPWRTRLARANSRRGRFGFEHSNTEQTVRPRTQVREVGWLISWQAISGFVR
jgi:hypothetical protein